MHLMEVYYEHYYRENYWEQKKYIPYMVLIKDKELREMFKDYLETNDFQCVSWNDSYLGVLVNVELRRFGLINRPCKHSCVNDYNYSIDEFLMEVYKRALSSKSDESVDADWISFDPVRVIPRLNKGGQVYIRTYNRKGRISLVEHLESEGFTCIDNDSYNRQDIIDSGLPIVADMHDRTIFRNGNVTCASGAAQSKMIISDKEFYMLYASRKAKVIDSNRLIVT